MTAIQPIEASPETETTAKAPIPLALKPVTAIYRVLLGAVLLGVIYSGIPLGPVN